MRIQVDAQYLITVGITCIRMDTCGSQRVKQYAHGTDKLISISKAQQISVQRYFVVSEQTKGYQSR